MTSNILAPVIVAGSLIFITIIVRIFIYIQDKVPSNENILIKLLPDPADSKWTTSMDTCYRTYQYGKRLHICMYNGQLTLDGIVLGRVEKYVRLLDKAFEEARQKEKEAKIAELPDIINTDD